MLIQELRKLHRILLNHENYIFTTILSILSSTAAASSSLDGDNSTTITLHAGIMALPPYAVQNESGEWDGFMFDLMNLLMQNAKMNHLNVSLDIITNASDPYYLLNGENGREGVESYNDYMPWNFYPLTVLKIAWI